jgi:NADH:ubiquinone oxidoreductase subunit K
MKYAVSIVGVVIEKKEYQINCQVNSSMCIVQAVSREESIGLGYLIAQKLYPTWEKVAVNSILIDGTLPITKVEEAKIQSP